VLRSARPRRFPVRRRRG